MAIIDEFTANILVNDQPCKEYGEGAEDGRGPKKVINHIEAISGPYKIYFKVSPLFEFTTTAISLNISIDGYLEDRLYIEPDHRGIRRLISKIPGGAGYLSFFFDEIKRTKGQDTMDPYIPDDKIKSVGTILIEVYRIDHLEQTPRMMRTEPPDVKVLPAQRKIPEKKLKELGLTSLTHSTRFVETKSSERWSSRSATQVDTRPLAAFEFKYCSKRWLQTLYPIPIEFPIRPKARMKEPLNVTKIQQPNIELPIRLSTHPLQKPSIEEPLNFTKIREPNIQENQDVPIKEGPDTTVIGRRKREHHDEGESEEQMGKSRKRSKAFKPSDPCGEHDKGGRTKSQGHPHPRNPRPDTHRRPGN